MHTNVLLGRFIGDLFDPFIEVKIMTETCFDDIDGTTKKVNPTQAVSSFTNRSDI